MLNKITLMRDKELISKTIKSLKVGDTFCTYGIYTAFDNDKIISVKHFKFDEKVMSESLPRALNLTLPNKGTFADFIYNFNFNSITAVIEECRYCTRITQLITLPLQEGGFITINEAIFDALQFEKEKNKKLQAGYCLNAEKTINNKDEEGHDNPNFMNRFTKIQ